MLQRIAERANSDSEPGTTTVRGAPEAADPQYRVTRSHDDGNTFIIFGAFSASAAADLQRSIAPRRLSMRTKRRRSSSRCCRTCRS